MKKIFLLTIALLVPSYPLQADTQTVAAKIIKCSWHATKIGGGILSAAVSFTPLHVALIAQGISPLSKPTGNAAADNQAENTYLANLEDTLNKHNITQERLEEILVWYANRFRDHNHKVTDFKALTGEQVCLTIDSLRSFARNRGLALFLGLFVSGSASIASGLHGLYEELIASDDKETTDENAQETATA